MSYYQDDHSLPIYASLDYGYPLDRIIDVLLTSFMPPEHVCTVKPLGVSENTVFLVDIDIINFEDLKADDLGSWKGTGTKKHILECCHQELLGILNADQIQANRRITYI